MKCLCFNLSMLVHSIHELGIEPRFWLPEDVPIERAQDVGTELLLETAS